MLRVFMINLIATIILWYTIDWAVQTNWIGVPWFIAMFIASMAWLALILEGFGRLVGGTIGGVKKAIDDEIDTHNTLATMDRRLGIQARR